MEVHFFLSRGPAVLDIVSLNNKKGRQSKLEASMLAAAAAASHDHALATNLTIMAINANHRPRTFWAWDDKLRSPIRLKIRPSPVPCSILVPSVSLPNQTLSPIGLDPGGSNNQRLHSLDHQSYSANDEGDRTLLLQNTLVHI